MTILIDVCVHCHISIVIKSLSVAEKIYKLQMYLYERYFYHLSADENSIVTAGDGTSTVKGVRSEFPDSADPEDESHWITGDLDANFRLPVTYPADRYEVYQNHYQPRESTMIVWAGKQHFGVIVGEPGSTTLTKYLIY